MATQHSTTSPQEITVLAGLCSDDPALQHKALQDVATMQLGWEKLIAFAELHNVSPLLYRCVKQLNLNLTNIQLATLRQRCRNITLNNLRIESELLRISTLLNTSGINHLVIKGPVIARYAYGDLGLRQFNDYDLLASHSDVLRIREALQQAGYETIVPLNALHLKKLHYFEKEVTYVKPEPGARRYEADIHWLLLRPALQVPLSFEDLWKQSVDVLIGEQLCKTMNPTYTFLSTCIHHGGNEIWNNLKHVADLHAILVRWSHEIDWNEVWHIAQRLDLELLVSSALLLTQKIFHTPVPNAAMEMANRYPQAVVIASKLQAFPHPEQYSRWAAIKAHLQFRRKRWTKARVLFKSILESLAPNFADQEFLPMPHADRLFGAYYFIRPIRILFSGKNEKRF